MPTYYCDTRGTIAPSLQDVIDNQRFVLELVLNDYASTQAKRKAERKFERAEYLPTGKRMKRTRKQDSARSRASTETLAFTRSELPNVREYAEACADSVSIELDLIRKELCDEARREKKNLAALVERIHELESKELNSLPKAAQKYAADVDYMPENEPNSKLYSGLGDIESEFPEDMQARDTKVETIIRIPAGISKSGKAYPSFCAIKGVYAKAHAKQGNEPNVWLDYLPKPIYKEREYRRNTSKYPNAFKEMTRREYFETLKPKMIQSQTRGRFTTTARVSFGGILIRSDRLFVLPEVITNISRRLNKIDESAPAEAKKMRVMKFGQKVRNKKLTTHVIGADEPKTYQEFPLLSEL